VGTRHHVISKHPNAPIRDLGPNMTILPGLYDSHGHIMYHGEMLQSVNLFGADSYQGSSTYDLLGNE
jgi:predicted amidohydrolase YtcJ